MAATTSRRSCPTLRIGAEDAGSALFDDSTTAAFMALLSTSFTRSPLQSLLTSKSREGKPRRRASSGSFSTSWERPSETPRRNLPCGSAPSATLPDRSSRAWSTRRPCARACWPAGVRVGGLLVRSKRTAPSSASRRWMRRDTAGWVRLSRAAAPCMEPASATARKARISEIFMPET